MVNDDGMICNSSATIHRVHDINPIFHMRVNLHPYRDTASYTYAMQSLFSSHITACAAIKPANLVHMCMF